MSNLTERTQISLLRTRKITRKNSLMMMILKSLSTSMIIMRAMGSKIQHISQKRLKVWCWWLLMKTWMAISNKAIKLHLSIDRDMKQTKIYKKNSMNKTKLFSFKKQKLPLFNLNLRNLCSNWHRNKLVVSLKVVKTLKADHNKQKRKTWRRSTNLICKSQSLKPNLLNSSSGY